MNDSLAEEDLRMGGGRNSGYCFDYGNAGTGDHFDHRTIEAHASGTQIASDLPTPGAPDRYPKLR